MNCCVKCFKDNELKAIIRSYDTSGECSFCGSSSYVCDLENERLKELFERLLDIYSPIEHVDDDNPLYNKADLLKNLLKTDWSIFELSPSEISNFLKKLLPIKYKEESKLFNQPVLLKTHLQDELYKQYSLLNSCCWQDFTTEIKTKNRFYTSILNIKILESLINLIRKSYRADSQFFRARTWTANSKYSRQEMGPPPPSKSNAGRANPEGISCLYLADTLETALHEVRSGTYDKLTIGTFRLQTNIELIDLSSIAKISPFRGGDLDLLATNLIHLKDIENDISRPLRRHDSQLDYLPTQYLCEYIKHLGYDGIMYKSTMCPSGVNYAIFDSTKLECIDVIHYEIDSLKYGYKTLVE